MFEYIIGDIFSSPAQVIVNTVNTMGVMGKGLALSFKKKYPDMFKAYQIACDKKQLMIGKLLLFYAPDHWILLFPTKENWRYPSKIEYLEKGLQKFVNTYAQKNITSIAFPRLGCGNGELNWDDVKPIMEKYLKNLPIDVFIYLGKNYDEEPEHSKPEDTIAWLRENARDMSFSGLKDDLVHKESLLPSMIELDHERWFYEWNDGVVYQNAGQIIRITEDELFIMWDEIRNKGIFSITSSSIKSQLLYRTLESLGYLTPIKVQNSKSGTLMDGYQVNEGSARLFALKGNS